MSWSSKRSFGTASGTCYCMQINVMRHFTSRAIFKMKLYLIAFFHPNQFPGNIPAESPEIIFNSVI